MVAITTLIVTVRLSATSDDNIQFKAVSTIGGYIEVQLLHCIRNIICHIYFLEMKSENSAVGIKEQ